MNNLVERFNALAADQVVAELLGWCEARGWAERVLRRRPYADHEELLLVAEEEWAVADQDEVLNAINGHPRIGADLSALREKYAGAEHSAAEQAGVAAATEETLVALRDANLAYEERHGHVFIVCATGKSAAEMLAILLDRMKNEPADELARCAVEIGKITRIRMERE